MKTMRHIALIGASAVALTGCGTTFSDLPLPGKAVSGDTYRLTAQFDDALNLPVGANVKIGGVQIGKVQKVTVKDFKAVASMVIQKKAQLHEGSTYRLRGTTPLGELFVEVVDNPKGAPLADGTEIQTTSTSTAATIEDSLAATSVLLNGGSLGNLGTLLREVNKALDGRQDKARNVLSKADALVKQLAASTDDITAALSALAQFAKTLDNRKATINAALDQIRPAAKVLTDNTSRLTDLFVRVDSLSGVARSTIAQTRAQLTQVLKQMGPILDGFSALDGVVDPSIKAVSDVTKILGRAVPNDYLNIYLNLHLDTATSGGAGGLLGLVTQSRSAVPLSTAGGSSIPTIPGAGTATTSTGGSK